MKERMGENKVESQADSYVNKKLIAAYSLWSMVFLFHIFDTIPTLITTPAQLNLR
jgi:hypothetical protein